MMGKFITTPPFLHLCLIFARRHACMMLEIFPEERRVREVHVISHFLDGHGRIFQECLGFQYDIVVNPLAGRLSAHFLDDGRKMLRAQEKLFGIEIHTSFLPMIFTHQADKFLEEDFFALQRLGSFGLQFRTMAIENRT